MGLASSQARLLQLTARMHQIEYGAARIEAMKLQMANESRRVYEDYLDALDQCKIQKKTLTTNGAVTFVDMQHISDFTSAGFAVVVHGVQVEEEDPETHETVTVTKSIVCTQASDFQKQEIIDVLGNDISDGITNHFEETLTNLINSGHVTIIQKPADPSKYDASEIDENGFPVPGSHAFADLETSVAINTSLQEVTDEVKLRKAEAKYEADMKRIDMKDRRYDTELAALDNERNAIKQEMETLKTVAKDNVERTFKIFS